MFSLVFVLCGLVASISSETKNLRTGIVVDSHGLLEKIKVAGKGKHHHHKTKGDDDDDDDDDDTEEETSDTSSEDVMCKPSNTEALTASCRCQTMSPDNDCTSGEYCWAHAKAPSGQPERDGTNDFGLRFKCMEAARKECYPSSDKIADDTETTCLNRGRETADTGESICEWNTDATAFCDFKKPCDLNDAPTGCTADKRQEWGNFYQNPWDYGKKCREGEILYEPWLRAEGLGVCAPKIDTTGEGIQHCPPVPEFMIASLVYDLNVSEAQQVNTSFDVQAVETYVDQEGGASVCVLKCENDDPTKPSKTCPEGMICMPKESATGADFYRTMVKIRESNIAKGINVTASSPPYFPINKTIHGTQTPLGAMICMYDRMDPNVLNENGPTPTPTPAPTPAPASSSSSSDTDSNSSFIEEDEAEKEVDHAKKEVHAKRAMSAAYDGEQGDDDDDDE